MQIIDLHTAYRRQRQMCIRDRIKETSWNSPAQIQIYMAKALIPSAGVLLIIQGISEVFRSIICIQTGHWPARMVVAEETEKMLMRTSQDEDQKDVI